MGKPRHGQAQHEPGKGGRAQRETKAKRGDAQATGDPDDHFHQIPFRLREIMKSQELMKTKTTTTRRRKKTKREEEEGKGKGKPTPRKIKGPAGVPGDKMEDAPVADIPVPHFKRGKEESKRAYLLRMNQETEHVLFLTRNQVERKPELEEETQEKPTKGRKSEKKQEYNKSRLQRLHQKKLNRQEKEMEKTMYIDHVKFGEVAMAPPTLSVKPRKAPEKNCLTKGLLLNSLLGHTVSSTAKTSMARKRIMEEERVRVVEAYRHLKRQKQKQQELRAAGLEKLKDL